MSNLCLLISKYYSCFMKKNSFIDLKFAEINNSYISKDLKKVISKNNSTIIR